MLLLGRPQTATVTRLRHAQLLLYFNPFNASRNQRLHLVSLVHSFGKRPLHLPSVAQSKSTQPLQCFLRDMDARRE
jgi:hypothetical protein